MKEKVKGAEPFRDIESRYRFDRYRLDYRTDDGSGRHVEHGGPTDP